MSVCATQLPLLVEVKTKFTFPFVKSPAPKWYSVVKLVALGENVPDPNVLHSPVVAPLETFPCNNVKDDEEQTVWFIPALTSTPAVMVNSRESITWLQSPFPIDVK